MMFYALIEDGVVRQVLETSEDINTLFHSSMLWVGCDSSVKPYQSYSEGVFTDTVEKPQPLTKEELESLRLLAYANPVSGCDRYFSEVMSLQAEGYDITSLEVKEVRDKGLSRKAEIQALYPYPSE